MKKMLIALCLSSFVIGFSQEKETPNFKKNELKGNALLLLVGAFDVSYEKINDRNLGYGISTFIAYDDKVDRKFGLTPYTRVYFGKKKAAGFFIEGFGMLHNYKTTAIKLDTDNYYYFQKTTVTDFALGFGLGGKWVTKSGVLFEINTGIGRNLFYKEDNVNRGKFVSRGGISIGYRF